MTGSEDVEEYSAIRKLISKIPVTGRRLAAESLSDFVHLLP